MANYVRELSIADILRGTVAIYVTHFRTILLTFSLPVFPAAALQEVAKVEGLKSVAAVAGFLVLVLQFIAQGALTITVSDVCLGHKPSTKRSYQRLSGALLGKLLLTALEVAFLYVALIMIAVAGVTAMGTGAWVVGLALPIAVLLVWIFLSTMFIAPVVILERQWGLAAIKRSWRLARGYLLRNLGAFVLLLIVVFVAGGIIGGIVGMIVPVQSRTFAVVVAAIQYLSAPLGLIAILLLYYDLRVRKEGYNMTTLAEDLMR
jgi:hypothetical protein